MGDKMKYKRFNVKKYFGSGENLDKVNLDKVTRYSKCYGTKINQKLIDFVSKDRNVFGNIIKGVDLGRMSEEEYMEFCEEKRKYEHKLVI
jgi:formiminotetrahydrofolate cyclodeaminase